MCGEYIYIYIYIFADLLNAMLYIPGSCGFRGQLSRLVHQPPGCCGSRGRLPMHVVQIRNRKKGQ